MIVWVLYDVSSDPHRYRIAKYCKQAGLYRVQYSVFLGTVSKNEMDSLALQIADEIDEDLDRVYIFQMSKSELKNSVLLGQAFNKDLVTDDIMALFF